MRGFGLARWAFKTNYPNWPSNPQVGIRPREDIHTKTCTQKFMIVALPAIVKRWKLDCPSANDWVNRAAHPYKRGPSPPRKRTDTRHGLDETWKRARWKKSNTKRPHVYHSKYRKQTNPQRWRADYWFAKDEGTRGLGNDCSLVGSCGNVMELGETNSWHCEYNNNHRISSYVTRLYL